MEEPKKPVWVESVGKGSDLLVAWPDAIHVLSVERADDEKWAWSVGIMYGKRPEVAVGESASCEEAKGAAEEAFESMCGPGATK